MPGTGDQRSSPIGSVKLLGCGSELGAARHKLRRDRVVRVAGIDQRRHVLRDGDRELLRHPPDLVEPAGLDQTTIDDVVGAQGQATLPDGARG